MFFVLDVFYCIIFNDLKNIFGFVVKFEFDVLLCLLFDDVEW